MSGHDPLDHVQALVGLQARDGRDTALRRVQKIGRRAERTAHRAVVERDQPYRADLRKVRLACGLAGQALRPDTRFRVAPSTGA